MTAKTQYMSQIRDYNITDFGAKAEIDYDNQEYIQSAIDTCFQDGGGRVIIPKGFWLTSPIELKSNVCLHAERGAYVRFTKIKEKYPLYYTEYEGRRAIRTISPVSAHNAVNISITGEGVFDGNGGKWRPKKDWKMTGREWEQKKTSKYIAQTEECPIWFPSETSYLGFLNYVDETQPNALEEASKYYDWYRPVFLFFNSCQNVRLSGVTFTNSPNWTIHTLYCKNVVVDGCFVKNPKGAQNSDGIDVESCEDVVIKNCSFDVGDDAICMKAGKGREARKKIAPTKNVEVYGCTVYHGHGGFVIGSEMSRGVEGVYVHDCTFIGTDTGIRVKSKLGRGGYVKDITIKDIVMSQIIGDCITISLGYEVESFLDKADNITEFDEDDLPKIGGIDISNVKCDFAGRFLYISGLNNAPVKDVTISHSSIIADKGTDISNAQNITLKEVTLNGKKL